jgi:hypothetical protein
MDPTANLARQLAIAAEIIGIRDSGEDDGDVDAEIDRDEQVADLADELADLVQALDEWMKKGGALPDQWNRA